MLAAVLALSAATAGPALALVPARPPVVLAAARAGCAYDVVGRALDGIRGTAVLQVRNGAQFVPVGRSRVLVRGDFTLFGGNEFCSPRAAARAGVFRVVLTSGPESAVYRTRCERIGAEPCRPPQRLGG